MTSAIDFDDLDHLDMVVKARAPKAELAAHPSGGPTPVLVVDDDRAFRTMLKGLLTGFGYQVHVATNAKQAFEMAIELQPRIMVVDWIMPGMSGIDLVRALRHTRAGRRIYVLVLTDLDDDEHLMRAFDAGVDDFIAKPLRPMVLAARLRGGQRVTRLQDEIEREYEETGRVAAELAVANRRLQEAALTDPLTGFPNRRFALQRLAQEWSAAARGKRPLACMVIDLDEFKPINDRYGHDVGDTVLKQAALGLKRGLRTQDMVARIGGDEFLVICPDTTLQAALACAERVRQSVEAMPIATGPMSLRATVSIGVAVVNAAIDDIDALIKCADQGLYIAKAQGRNRIGTFQPDD
jgi:diguanylate cyclase (GGDEF)-like protein